MPVLVLLFFLQCTKNRFTVVEGLFFETPCREIYIWMNFIDTLSIVIESRIPEFEPAVFHEPCAYVPHEGNEFCKKKRKKKKMQLFLKSRTNAFPFLNRFGCKDICVCGHFAYSSELLLPSIFLSIKQLSNRYFFFLFRRNVAFWNALRIVIFLRRFLYCHFLQSFAE